MLDVYPDNWIDETKLKQILNDFDYIVCGSDQIWNISEKVDDKSICYFLNCNGNFKKISYAASFGDNIIEVEKQKEKFIPLLKDFSNISVRENDAKEFLKLNGIDSELTIDPTLLLDKMEWNNIAKDLEINEPYILYYSVNSRQYSIDITKKISKKMNGIKVINLVLHPKSGLSGFEYKIDCNPEEFLALVKNAKMICTNSFHGTVFSIIFEKPFIAMFDMHDGQMIKEERKYTLLKELGLESRIYTVKSKIDVEKILDTDYKESKKKLDDLKRKSLEYIKESLK